MAVSPLEFCKKLLEEAKRMHPFLHHPLYYRIFRGELSKNQLCEIIKQQGCFYLDTLRHAAWKIVSVGGYTPTIEDLEQQRALIPLVVAEGGEDMVGGKTTAHSLLFVRLAESLGIAKEELFRTAYLPTTVIEKDELFLLQRSSILEALCGGNIATESIHNTHCQKMAIALGTHYGVPREALEFYYVHVEVEKDHEERAVHILEKIAVNDEQQARGLLALRRAITARRIFADGAYEAFVKV
ncbi:MAG: iron-containing redox enzyme family protein [Deltaproteobacteria bacterium]|nr:iron-containing redox enzyme family protein [Deltaproteobacteria bacterium]